MAQDFIKDMFISKEEQKIETIRARLIANGVLQPKQINKKKKKSKKRK